LKFSLIILPAAAFVTELSSCAGGRRRSQSIAATTRFEGEMATSLAADARILVERDRVIVKEKFKLKFCGVVYFAPFDVAGSEKLKRF
jgi:hypothetical protein